MAQLKKQSWTSYFLDMAQMAATRTTCLSPAKGAVIVKNKSIVSTGYNGAPRGVPDCKYQRGECIKRRKGYEHGTGHHVCLAAHAEANAIAQAARTGVAIEGSTMYCTHKPCRECAKLIINSGIIEVVYIEDYPNDSEELFHDAGVRIRRSSDGTFRSGNF